MPVPQSVTYGTLTKQQQQMMDQLQGNITSAGKPVDLSPSATANYVNQAVAQPLLQQYDQSIMPRLKDSFAAVGALMGSRRGFASQQALGNLQTTIASEMGKAQLANQQLSAQLALQYNQLGAGLVGQSHMAIQPYIDSSAQMKDLMQGWGGQQGFGSQGVNQTNANGLAASQYAATLGAQLSGAKNGSNDKAQSFSDFLDQMLNDPASQKYSPEGDFPDYGYGSYA